MILTNIRRRAAALGWVSAGFIMLAAPVAAQGICGGMGDGGLWVGGSERASDISTAPGPFDTGGDVPVNGELITLFSLSSPADIRVEALPADGSDSVIDLLDDSGALILSDDDGGGGLSSRGETSLSPGTYCLLTRGLDGSSASVQVRVGRTEHAALTVGATTTQEPEICTRDTLALQLADGPLESLFPAGVTNSASATDVPFLGFTLSSPRAISVTAENADADPVLTLYDADGVLIQENDDFDGLNSRIDVTEPLSPGYYCLGVRALSNTDAPITVSVVEFDQEDFQSALYDQGENSPPLDGSYPVADLGILETRKREDVSLGHGVSWFSVEMFDGDLLLIEAIAVGDTDPTLVLFDDLGRKLAENDDHGEGLNSQLSARVRPGIYVIGVGQVGEESGGTVRLALERYERAR